MRLNLDLIDNFENEPFVIINKFNNKKNVNSYAGHINGKNGCYINLKISQPTNNRELIKFLEIKL